MISLLLIKYTSVITCISNVTREGFLGHAFRLTLAFQCVLVFSIVWYSQFRFTLEHKTFFKKHLRWRRHLFPGPILITSPVLFWDGVMVHGVMPSTNWVSIWYVGSDRNSLAGRVWLLQLGCGLCAAMCNPLSCGLLKSLVQALKRNFLFRIVK